jgi:Fe-S-cluster containining protein
MSEASSPPSLKPVEAVDHLAQRQGGLIERELTVLQESGGAVSCRSGCGACCRQLVVVSPLEALVIDEHVQAADAAQRQRWEAAHARHHAALAQRPSLLRRLQWFRAAGGYIRPEEGDALEREYWAAQLPCPFLKEERCSIYPVRPFVCREHFALSPPELCARDLDAVQCPPTRFEFRAIAGRVGDQCFDLDDHLIPLFHALEYAAECRDARDRSAPRSSVLRVLEAALARVLAWWRVVQGGPTSGRREVIDH